MIAGPIKVSRIHWGERTMTLHGDVWYAKLSVVSTVAYDHVAASGLVDDEGCVSLRIYVGVAQFDMTFQDANNARDAAAELARRMEACR